MIVVKSIRNSVAKDSLHTPNPRGNKLHIWQKDKDF